MWHKPHSTQFNSSKTNTLSSVLFNCSTDFWTFHPTLITNCGEDKQNNKIIFVAVGIIQKKHCYSFIWQQLNWTPQAGLKSVCIPMHWRLSLIEFFRQMTFMCSVIMDSLRPKFNSEDLLLAINQKEIVSYSSSLLSTWSDSECINSKSWL